MDWDILKSLILPVGSGLGVMILTYFLRRFLYSYIHKLTARTKTRFDDILIRETRLATLFWCIWLSIFTSWKLAEIPVTWVGYENKVIAVLFVALGIYTGIMIVTATLKWYRDEICPLTTSSLDDIIMVILIYGAPIIGGALGLIQVLNMLGFSNDTINSRLSEYLPGVATITTLGVTILLVTTLIIPRIIRTAVHNSRTAQSEEDIKKREDTLINVISTTIQGLIIFIFALMLVVHLVSWEVITPILTATGVVGVALGFGAQSVIKDLLAGLFIIMENQYRKGDVVRIADISGVVEEINLRRTILRDMDGIYHVVPNGEIKVASNFTLQWSRVNLDISVSYNTDLDKAMSVINKVGEEMARDPVWMTLINTPPKALRVNKLGDSGIDIKIVGDVKPSQQWAVAGELRLRLKKAFDKEDIEIPWPHTKVYFGNQPPQFPVRNSGFEDIENPAKKLKN